MGLFKRAKIAKEDFGAATGLTVTALGAVHDSLKQAKDMTAQHAGLIDEMSHVDMAAASAQATRRMHIQQNGVEGTGTLVSARQTDHPAVMPDNVVNEIVVNLTTGPGAPRQLTIYADAFPDSASQYIPGSEQVVKIDPANPDDAIMWAHMPTGLDAKLPALEQLAAMKATGALPDATFEAMKAKLMAQE
jgi:hypothetical protein